MIGINRVKSPTVEQNIGAGCEIKERSEVERELSALADRIQLATMAVVALTDRLASGGVMPTNVAQSTSGNDAGPLALPACASPLGADIQRYAAEVSSIEYRVRRLVEDLCI